MEDFEIEIKKSFLDEATSLLEDTESAFISLETIDDPTDHINNIFRLAHSFKGSAKAVGFEGLAHLAHYMEDVLTLLKSNRLKITPYVTTLLLKTVDVLRIYLSGLKSDFNFAYDTSEICHELMAIKNSEGHQQEFENKINGVTENIKQSLANSTSDNNDSNLEEPDDENTESNSSNAFVNLTDHTNKKTSELFNPKTQSTEKIVPKNVEDENIRVAVKKLDTLLNFVGEMVVQKSILDQNIKDGNIQVSDLVNIFSYMSKLVTEVQTVSMSLRMVPIKPLFQRLKRTLRDVAQIQQKDVELMTQGDDVELDKLILDRIIDPLTHIIRNAVDHGIENEADRLIAGKTEKATVWLEAVQEDNIVKIIVKDNGRGLNKKKIIEKAIQNGLINSADNLSENEIYKLIFKPGFSTKEVVTDISGRGVGMDVVLQTVQELKGSVEIQSIEGKGSVFTINIPLSHAILGGIIISVDDTKYIVPLPHLVETIRLNRFNPHSTKNGERVINLRGEIIPVFNLSDALNMKGFRSQKNNRIQSEQGIIVHFDNQKSCFEIDAIHGQQEIVIKKIGKEIGSLPGIIGAGIIGSGEVSLILNLKDFSLKGARYGNSVA